MRLLHTERTSAAISSHLAEIFIDFTLLPMYDEEKRGLCFTASFQFFPWRENMLNHFRAIGATTFLSPDSGGDAFLPGHRAGALTKTT